MGNSNISIKVGEPIDWPSMLAELTGLPIPATLETKAPVKTVNEADITTVNETNTPSLPQKTLSQITEQQSSPLVTIGEEKKTTTSWGDIANATLQAVLPLPLAQTVTAISNADSAQKEASKGNSEQKPSLWDSITEIASKPFQGFTKPFTDIWSSYTKTIGYEGFKLSDLIPKRLKDSFNSFIDLFKVQKEDLDKATELARELDKRSRTEEENEARQLKADLLREAALKEEDKRIAAKIAEDKETARQIAEKAEADAKARAKVAAEEEKAREARLAENKAPNNEHKSTIDRLLSTAKSAGITTISLADLPVNISPGELMQKIYQEVASSNPNAGLALLEEMGRNNLNNVLAPLFNGNNSTVLSGLLNKCLNSKSDDNHIKYLVDDHLASQQRHSITA